MSDFDLQTHSLDAFLGGRIRLWQPKTGYRAGIDPVLLAASLNIVPGQSVLDLGCGAGQMLFCLSARVRDLTLVGLERQEEYASLAKRNGIENNVSLEIHHADLAELPAALRSQSFDHIVMNPPYYSKGAHSSARDTGRAMALGEDTPMDLWLSVAAKRLKPKGYVHAIQRADRLPELLAACDGRFGSVEVLPLAARSDRSPDRVILRARKDGRAPFRLHAAFVLHEGERHEGDRESYRSEVRAILREGATLPWPN